MLFFLFFGHAAARCREKLGRFSFTPLYLSVCALPVSRHFPLCPENLRAQRKRFYTAHSAGDFRLQQNNAPCRAQRRQGAPAFQKPWAAASHNAGAGEVVRKHLRIIPAILRDIACRAVLAHALSLIHISTTKFASTRNAP